MRKYLLLTLMLAAVVLSSCLPQVQATPTSTATATARPISTAVQSSPAQVQLLPDSGCTVISQKPTPGPTPVPVYPPVTASDWVKGPASAKVTIIEYSDFQ